MRRKRRGARRNGCFRRLRVSINSVDNRKKVKTWAETFGGSLFRTFASEVLESQNTDSCGRCPVRKWKLGLYSER